MKRDTKVQERIAGLLFWGMCACGAVALGGGIVNIIQQKGALVDYKIFIPHLVGIAGTVRSAARLQGAGIAQIGLFLLVLMQLVRVSAGIRLFTEKGSRVYVLISLFILCALSASLFI